MLTEGGAALADIYRHIQHCTLYYPHQFALGVWRQLKMQATQYAPA